jgi:PAS domain S-box-containing protein/putative nucleotidyltransferase with HDIG domain
MPRKPVTKTQKQLIAENEDLLRRLEEAEETLNAIRNGKVDGIIVSGVEGEQVYTLKQAEEALRVSEEKYRKLVDENRDGFFITNSQGLLTFANPALARILGVKTPQMLVSRKFSEFLAPEMRKELLESTQGVMENGGGSGAVNGQIKRKDGTCAFIEMKPVRLFKDGKASGTQGVIRDITERKRAEEALQESEAEYRSLFENSVVGISQALPDGHIIRANCAFAQMFGYASPEEMMAEVTSLGKQLYVDAREQDEMMRALKDKGRMEPREFAVVRRDGTHFFVLVSALAIKDSGGNLRFYQAEHVEITQRKLAEERIKRQLEHLLALSSIDRLIASNFDLNLSLSEILIYVTKELGVDATDILLLNPGLQMLEFGAGQGFLTNTIRNTHVRLGESYAGRAVLERQLVQISDLQNEPENLFRQTLMTGENFACYYGVPLIAKGQVKGVLEVFHRHLLHPDTEWFDFLNTLAGQTAIAIENSTLFESLQRSNSELGLAYDATIEGWSCALDLRDKETEGHTQRVTEMTVKLARLIGSSEADLVKIRWGSLLHDIGKMGVPDGILLKPGPLTDEEWLVMKKHPSFAYEMLSPIRYLRLALDIPYCHHEKWDGSGYPRGLKGTQIPLAGRIFAVVDVWDALRSDRPYRDAWPEEKVREYIRGSAGTHFDPEVVDDFMQLLDLN